MTGPAMTTPRELADMLDQWTKRAEFGESILLAESAKALRTLADQQEQCEEMRLTLVTQIHELIDIAERHAWTSDEAEARRTNGAIAYARNSVKPYNYNGAARAQEPKT